MRLLKMLSKTRHRGGQPVAEQLLVDAGVEAKALFGREIGRRKWLKR